MFHSLGAKVVAVTLGDAGTLISTNEGSSIINSIKIKCIDSTGAGDAFVGAFLYKLSQLKNPKSFIDNSNIIKDIILFSNKVGAITCTKLGAIASLPTLEEVQLLK